MLCPEVQNEGFCLALCSSSQPKVMALDSQVSGKVQAIGITELPQFFAFLARYKTKTVALCQLKSSIRTACHFD